MVSNPSVSKVVQRKRGNIPVSDSRRGGNTANPATVYWINQGKPIRMRDNAYGQYAEVYLNGQWVDEWAAYRERREKVERVRPPPNAHRFLRKDSSLPPTKQPSRSISGMFTSSSPKSKEKKTGSLIQQNASSTTSSTGYIMGSIKKKGKRFSPFDFL